MEMISLIPHRKYSPVITTSAKTFLSKEQDVCRTEEENWKILRQEADKENRVFTP